MENKKVTRSTHVTVWPPSKTLPRHTTKVATIMSTKRGPSSQSEDMIVSKRPRTILPQHDALETIFIDHAYMDTVVLMSMNFHTGTQFPKEQDLPEDKLPVLLSCIIETERRSNGSSRKLQESGVPELSELVANDPKIRDALQLAWRDQSFKNIRSSSVYINVQCLQPGTDCFLSQCFSGVNHLLVMCPFCMHTATDNSSSSIHPSPPGRKIPHHCAATM